MQIFMKMDELQDIYDLLERSINDDPPILIREGGIFKDGYLEEIDTLKSARQMARHGLQNWRNGKSRRQE